MDRYAVGLRLLHWLIALIVVPQIFVGLMLWQLGFQGTVDTFGSEMTNAIYKYHKTFGVVVLGLIAIRVILRASTRVPPSPADVPDWMATTGRYNHYALYALLIAQPVVGWAATAAGGFPVEFFNVNLPGVLAKDSALSEQLFTVHGYIGAAMLALVVLHIGAALYHWKVRRDGVMRRIALT